MIRYIVCLILLLSPCVYAQNRNIFAVPTGPCVPGTNTVTDVSVTPAQQYTCAGSDGHTWVAVGAAGNGVISVNGQAGAVVGVAFLAGTTPFSATQTFNIGGISYNNWTLIPSTPATNSVNQNSPSLLTAGNYWNGSASATDQWYFTDVLGAGTNPASTYTLAHNGSATNPKVSIPYPTVMTSDTSPVLSLVSTGTSFVDGFGLYCTFPAGSGTCARHLGQTNSAGDAIYEWFTYLGDNNAGNGYHAAMNGNGTNYLSVFNVNNHVTLNGNTDLGHALDVVGQANAQTFGTATNCSSAAAPAVCGAAAAGSVNIATSASSVVVNTTAVTASSQILITPDDSLSTKLGVTCNSTLAVALAGFGVIARTPGTSFTIGTLGTVTVNPACYSYTIVN